MTDAVLAIDDDILMLTAEELEFAYKVLLLITSKFITKTQIVLESCKDYIISLTCTCQFYKIRVLIKFKVC